jgi:hypothetical protein
LKFQLQLETIFLFLYGVTFSDVLRQSELRSYQALTRNRLETISDPDQDSGGFDDRRGIRGASVSFESRLVSHVEELEKV